jgi:hypothetical protein
MRKAVLIRASVLTIAALLSGTTLLSGIAQAQPQPMICGLRDDMGKMLVQRFGEHPQAAGIVGDRVVELLVSQTGSWTILITSTDGRSCVVTGGEDWTAKPVMPSKVTAAETL